LDARLRNAGYEIWWLPGAAIRHFIHASRLNLKWLLRSAFNSGRTTAIRRLKTRAGCNRLLYAVGRLLVAPLHCGVNLLVALVSFPFQNGRVAAGKLIRAASITGLACELLRQIFRGDRA
jgi:GT2 family glycosyltransferase